MTTFLLIPGAGGDPGYWRELVPELRGRGHTAVPVDLPAADESAGWAVHTGVAVETWRAADPAGSPDLVVVAQSLGAYVGPLVCVRVPARLLVLLNPMIPVPGESAAQWWQATGLAAARTAAGFGDFDPVLDFFHDVPARLAAEVLAGEPREQSDRSFAEPWPAAGWPDVRTVVLQGREDRLFPPAFQRRVARERLGLEIEELPGGHLLALGYPVDLADRLVSLAASVAV